MFTWTYTEALLGSPTTGTIHRLGCWHAPGGLDAIRYPSGRLVTSSVAPKPCRTCRPPVIELSSEDLAAVASPPRFRVYRDGVLIAADPTYDVDRLHERLAAR